MDNYMKDNKNHHLLAFLSLLTTRTMFKEVQLKFLVIGHTHKDIEGNFGYLFKKLKECDNYVLVT
jgi:hypothetical protein